MTWRDTIVPVVELTSAATATADEDSDSFAEDVIVPVTAPGTLGGADVTTTLTPLVGPPVMTGTGSNDWYAVEPSTIEANSA